jgi:heat shock protein HslJ
MSRGWAVSARQFCRRFVASRSGIVLVVGTCAAIIWLWVGGFPVNQSYEVVAINGRLLPQFITTNHRLVTKYRPTLRVDRTLFGETQAGGWNGCNFWNSRVQSLRSGGFALGPSYQTANACRPAALENGQAFNAALGRVTRWRRERGELVLEGDGVSIRLRPRATTSDSQLDADGGR